ncbi:MAG: hypothetical protein K2K72_07285, partial [Duncaniella sp.]|nr:hypothetical protein [Duncaniella sp.]
MSKSTYFITMNIYCVNLQEYIPFAGGESLASVAARLGDRLGFTPACARVNNKDEGLSFPLYAPKQVEFLPATSAQGQRSYIKTLCMVLYRALETVAPGARLQVLNAVSGGYFCQITQDGKPVADPQGLAQALKAQMIGIIDADLPIERKEKPTREVTDMFRAQGLEAKVELLESLHPLYPIYYRLEGLGDTTLSPLFPSTGLLDA